MLRRTALSLSLFANFGATVLPRMYNEPCLTFAPDSPEAISLKNACDKVRSEVHIIPVVIDGKRYYPSKALEVPIPSANKTVLFKYHNADEELMKKAIHSSLKAHKTWSEMSFQARVAIILKAAELLSKSPWRWDVASATMVGQSKNPQQAEIDCITEACDFLRFHSYYLADTYQHQPLSPEAMNVWNMTEYRPLEGFVTSISPFNFTAIGLNLAATPALAGNTVLWKPSPGSMLANYRTFCLLEESGLPPGVINFVPTTVPVIEHAIKNPNLAGLAFTGSTATFRAIWKNIGSHIDHYKNFPRVSGETGGKNFHLIHPSAHLPTVIAQTIRAAFEYQGQKCSACSRLFVPKSKWEEIKMGLLKLHAQIKQGQPDDFTSFMCAVIDRAAYERIVRYLDIMKREDLEIIAGGGYSDKEGWFIEPTIAITKDLNAITLKEEIFGPVLTVYVYDDNAPGFWAQVCKYIDEGAVYGLTGAIFCRDREAIEQAKSHLRYACGMLYINDKSTGAVVGQQPFGGARCSGTNDKPGGPRFVGTWMSPRTIKENFDYMPQVSYPHQFPDIIQAPMEHKSS